MSPLVEIGHPDVDVGAEADRITAALKEGGLTVTSPLSPATVRVGVDSAGLDDDALQTRVEQLLDDAFPAFVGMNGFYAKVVGNA